MIENQGVRFVIGFICFIFGILAIYGIYSGFYKKSHDTEYAYLGNYALWVDKEGNVEDVSKQGDLLLIKKEDSYNRGDTVLFDYHGVGRLAKISKTTGSKYYLTDSFNTFDSEYEITTNTIVGRSITRFSKLGLLYNIICTPYASIIILVLLFFFAMTTLRRNE